MPAALVTGVATGIGRDLALDLAKSGHMLTVTAAGNTIRLYLLRTTLAETFIPCDCFLCLLQAAPSDYLHHALPFLLQAYFADCLHSIFGSPATSPMYAACKHHVTASHSLLHHVHADGLNCADTLLGLCAALGCGC